MAKKSNRSKSTRKVRIEEQYIPPAPRRIEDEQLSEVTRGFVPHVPVQSLSRPPSHQRQNRLIVETSS